MKKQIVLDILFKSFYNNKSVNFLVKQDRKKNNRIAKLLEYSYFMGEQFGEIILTPDNKSCAIIINPNKKKATTQVGNLEWSLNHVILKLSKNYVTT